MKLQVLETARDDLIEGFHFYEENQLGLGDYFLSSLYSDIESLRNWAVFIAKCIATFIAHFPSDFRLAFITRWKRALCWSEPWWTAGEIPPGFAITLETPE